MDILQVFASRRSIRRFTTDPVPQAALSAIADAARLAPTGVNRQPLAFAVAESRPLCARIFPHTRWAGKIPDGSASPDASTQPTAYIALLIDRQIAEKSDTDAGAAAMAMLLAAQAQGIASCWLASIDRTEILAILNLDASRYALHSLIAFGYPAMRSRAVPIENGQTDYYLEDRDSLCVPKRAANDVIFWIG